MWPFPSTSAAKTDVALSTVVLIRLVTKLWLPSFSYHAIVSSRKDAERTSMSPSVSTSAANTAVAPSAEVPMACTEKF